MKKISIAMIGIGGYGSESLKALLESEREDFEIVASVDPFPEYAPLFPALQQRGIPHFSALEEMYSVGIFPQLCIISTPIQFHKEQILRCRAHGASVLCEKPLTGDVNDLCILEAAARKDGFIAVGYQWSYSSAIQKLKQDIHSGIYGKALQMKTIVLWPRNKAYFTRTTGWAGKVKASNGETIYDSVANNATAHYLHNMLYVLGDEADSAVSAAEIQAELFRANDIETFDTCVAKFTLENSTTGLLVVSHATDSTVNPKFIYTFEKGIVTYSAEQEEIIGTTGDGHCIHYGNPFANSSQKVFDCIEAVKLGSKNISCGVNAASAQVKFISKLHAENTIRVFPQDTLSETPEGQIYVAGLDKLLVRCYEENKLPSEIGGLL